MQAIQVQPVSPAASTAARASLLVLGAAAFMVQADARVIDTLLKIVADDFHTVPERVAIVVTAYTLPYGLFQLFYGPLGDRIGKLRIMSYCLAFFAFGTFACGFVTNLPAFVVLRFVTGVAAASIVPMSLSYIGDKFPYENRQIALGQFMSALMMGQVMSSLLGGIFGQYIGWRSVFLALGAGALVFSIALLRESRRFPEERKPGRKLSGAFFAVPAGGCILFVGIAGLIPGLVSGVLTAVGAGLLLYALATQYGYLLKRPSAAIVLGTVLLEGFFVFGAQPFLAASLILRFHVTTLAAGLMMAGFGVGGLFYSASVKKLVPRIGELGILMLGGLLLGCSFVAIGLIPNWQSFIPLVVLLGMGFYTMHSTLQTRATEIAPEARGTAISLFAFAFFMGQSTGPMVMGKVVELHGYPSAFVASGAGILVLAFAARSLFGRLRSSGPSAITR